MTWQDAAAALVVLGAVAFLVSRLVGRRATPTSKRPDVGADSLVRKSGRPRRKT